MKQGPERFLQPDQLPEKVKEWKSAVRDKETGKFFYAAGRRSEGFNSINELHGLSFIRDVIPELIKKKKNGEKVKILDVGAGAALFTDEIRKAFPNEVKVFSTGLRKKTAENRRMEKDNTEGQRKLHPDDLKWRSILELSDFEEFDLIIDTWGEYSYSTMKDSFDFKEIKDKAIEYFTILIKKLKPGGLASIVTAIMINFSSPEGQEILSFLEKKYNVKITIPPHNAHVLKIEKLDK